MCATTTLQSTERQTRHEKHIYLALLLSPTRTQKKREAPVAKQTLKRHEDVKYAERETGFRSSCIVVRAAVRYPAETNKHCGILMS